MAVTPGWRRPRRAELPAAFFRRAARRERGGGTTGRALVAMLPGQGDAVPRAAPGRVNLIGEHTDYNGAGPAVRHRATSVAAARATTGPSRSPAATVATRHGNTGRRAVAARRRRLGNYSAGVHRCIARAVRRRRSVAACRGDDPDGRGRLVSSALVVAAALAQLALAETSLERIALAEILARGEQYVGTLSGGMDQAAILLAQAEHAVRLDFFPLRARTVAIPGAASFILAHSLERAAKAGAARGHYNQRVVECRAACALLAQRLARPVERPATFRPGRRAARARRPAAGGARIARRVTARFGLEAAEVERLVPPQAVVPMRIASSSARPARAHRGGRVDAAEGRCWPATCRARRPARRVPRERRRRLRDQHPAADELVRPARGGRGARLMGAGFGGTVPSRRARALRRGPRGARPALLPTAPRRSRQPLHGRTGEWRDHRASTAMESCAGQSRFGEVREPVETARLEIVCPCGIEGSNPSLR